MAKAFIPVDLHNPGQVFACMGFLEAAETLLGGTVGGFDWRAPGGVRFEMEAAGNGNPFATVLQFLATAKIVRLAPPGYVEPPAKPSTSRKSAPEDQGQDATKDRSLKGRPRRTRNPKEVSEDSEKSIETLHSLHFPSPEVHDTTKFPVRLFDDDRCVELTHWSDGSTRDAFKLFAGSQFAPDIAHGLIRGEFEGRSRVVPGLRTLWSEKRDDLVRAPFDLCVAVQKCFYFDPRRNWDAIHVGYSPKGLHTLRSSPIVEVLAAWGLEHARPRNLQRRKVLYGVWGQPLPPILARAALAAEDLPFPIQKYSFTFGSSGKNRFVTTSLRETSQ